MGVESFDRLVMIFDFDFGAFDEKSLDGYDAHEGKDRRRKRVRLEEEEKKGKKRKTRRRKRRKRRKSSRETWS